MGVQSQELKHVAYELEVKVPASEVWELYRQLGISKLAVEQKIIQSFEVLKGNSSYTERFPVIDDHRRVKVGEGLEGGCLAKGCSVEIIQVDIVEKSYTSSIIKLDVWYAVKKEFEASDPMPNIRLMAVGAQAAKQFLESKHDA